jgi:hypothetical protein
MNNEPVAWAREDGVIAFFEKHEIDKQGFKWFPLYTHPNKDLKDEDIFELMQATKKELGTRNSPLIDYLKVFLRKANEK